MQSAELRRCRQQRRRQGAADSRGDCKEDCAAHRSQQTAADYIAECALVAPVSPTLRVRLVSECAHHDDGNVHRDDCGDYDDEYKYEDYDYYWCCLG